MLEEACLPFFSSLPWEPSTKWYCLATLLNFCSRADNCDRYFSEADICSWSFPVWSWSCFSRLYLCNCRCNCNRFINRSSPTDYTLHLGKWPRYYLSLVITCFNIIALPYTSSLSFSQSWFCKHFYILLKISVKKIFRFFKFFSLRNFVFMKLFHKTHGTMFIWLVNVCHFPT